MEPVMASSLEHPTAEEVHSQEHRTANAIVSMDALGIAASTLCLIHCLAMPFVITLLPVLGWQFLEGRNAHYFLASFVFAFALSAIVPGYLKHKRIDILCGMAVGLTCVLIATFAPYSILPEKLELPLITMGNIILVITHWRNRGLAICKHHDH
jgi:amino acid transporter